MSGSVATVGLGIDAGGTATRWCLVDRQLGKIATGAAGSISGHLFSDAAKAAAFAEIDAIAASLAGQPAPGAVVAGITGLDGDGGAAALLREKLAERLRLGRENIRVVNDMVIAYRAAFEPGGGILVYSGTGSIAFHLKPDGTSMRAGGLGIIIDDGGSGFWIAREAVKAVFRAEDRKPSAGFATPLGRAIAEAIGGAGWDHARAYIYRGDRGRVAALAPAVAQAERAGDLVARGILTLAGEELAGLAQSLLARLGPRDIVLAGGASFLSPVIAATFRQALGTEVAVRHEQLDPARAAAEMAISDLA